MSKKQTITIIRKDLLLYAAYELGSPQKAYEFMGKCEKLSKWVYTIKVPYGLKKNQFACRISCILAALRAKMYGSIEIPTTFFEIT